MANDAPPVECIVLGTTANVMDNKGPTATVNFVGDDADVIEAVGKLPHHNVAGAPLRTSTRGRQCGERLSITREENDLIHHATMIDVLVEFRMLIFTRINTGEAALVFVNETLQVEADSAQRTNYDIGASTSAARHVAIGVGQRII